jgi:streptomycin 6-kinase
MPHFEADDEIKGLRLWEGDPTVLLLEADEGLNAMLLERCEPGTSLRDLPEPEQDVVLSGLLRRLWRKSSREVFRPLASMLSFWTNASLDEAEHWPDPGLLREGLKLFEDLSRPTSDDVPLATDLHAGNVLRSRREPWLVIDPKPFVGDRAYDATQHLINCEARLSEAPLTAIRRFADLCQLDHERVRLWLFARAAAEPRADWCNSLRMELARTLAP